MDAILVLKSKDSQREVKIKDFITGVSKTILKNDEILTHIIIPKKDYKYSFYRKIGTRKANALSKLAICALVCKENDKYRFKISFCTLGITITRDESIEEKYIVSDVNEWKNNIKSIQEAYSSIMNPRRFVSVRRYAQNVSSFSVSYSARSSNDRWLCYTSTYCIICCRS